MYVRVGLLALGSPVGGPGGHPTPGKPPQAPSPSIRYGRRAYATPFAVLASHSMAKTFVLSIIILLFILFLRVPDAEASTPIDDQPTPPPTWTPFAFFVMKSYSTAEKKHDLLFTAGMGKRAAEDVYKQLFRTFCLVSTHREGSRFGPSGAWDTLVGKDIRRQGIAPDVGLLYDDIFLALNHPSPSIAWYTYDEVPTMTGQVGQGFWSNVIVPHLYNSGALGSEAAAGKKTITRLRWLLMVTQLGDDHTLQHGIDLANNILMVEDFEGESESSESGDSDGDRVSQPTSTPNQPSH